MVKKDKLQCAWRGCRADVTVIHTWPSGTVSYYCAKHYKEAMRFDKHHQEVDRGREQD